MTDKTEEEIQIEDNEPRYDLRLLIGFSLFFIAVNFSDEAQLFFDEAQYWTWSKQLDTGYFSKPPMIAWFIAASTSLCGDGIGCIKVTAPLAHLGSAFFIYLSGKKLFNLHIGYWSAFTYAALPGVAAGSLYISADAPLMLFWAASLYFFIRATSNNALKWWLLLGISAGLGMMSKYTMVIFYFSALIYLATTPNKRALLRQFKPWLAVCISLIIFAPNIIWNIENSFISISHTSENVLDSGRFQIHFTDTLEFIGAQFAIFGPLLFLTLCVLIPRKKDITTTPEMWLLKCFIFPLLFIAIFVSLIAGAQAHWASPIYLAASILCCAILLKEQDHSKILNTSLLISVLCIFIYLSINSIISIFNLEHNPNSRLIMWNTASKNFAEIAEKYPDAIYTADERKSVALLMHRMRDEQGNPAPIVKWNIDEDFDDYYDMSTSMEPLKKGEVLFLTRGEPATIKSYFNSGETISSFSFGKHNFHILLLSGFKGN